MTKLGPCPKLRHTTLHVNVAVQIVFQDRTMMSSKSVIRITTKIPENLPKIYNKRLPLMFYRVIAN